MSATDALVMNHLWPLLRVGGTVGEQLHVAAVRCLHAEDSHRHHAPTDDLRHQRQLELTESGAAELRVEEGAPEPSVLDLSLEVGLHYAPLVARQSVIDRLERYQLRVDELAHPRQLLGELVVGLEIPSHRGPVHSGRGKTVAT
jgi:hypothetical protein